MRRPAGLLALLGLALLSGCARDTVMTIRNNTACSFEEVQAFKVHPRTGAEELVFAFDRIDPRDARPAYFVLDWDGILRIRAAQPEGYLAEFEVRPGLGNVEIPLEAKGPMKCRFRSAEES